MLLSGVKGSKVRGMDIGNISGIDHDRFTFKLLDFLMAFHFISQDSNNSICWNSFACNDRLEKKPETPNLSFYLSYQDLEGICYTRESDSASTSLRNLDWMAFLQDDLETRFSYFGYFDVYIHSFGQLNRVLERPIFEEELHSLDEQNLSLIHISEPTRPY